MLMPPLSPEKPRGASTGRPHRPRAVEMDEALSMTGNLKSKLATASQRQELATKKVKDHKVNMKHLQEQVGTMERELLSARAEAERTRVDPEVKARHERLQADHATLQATHSWTKSSLDSTLAAQEEYRKGYLSLQAAYKKTKAELDEKQKRVTWAREAREEAIAIHASLPEREKEFQQDLIDAQDTLKNIMARQKKKSQAVLDKMLAGQSSSLVQLTFASWQRIISDEKFWRENAKNLEEAQKRLQDFQSRNKEDAKKVLDRMSAGNDSSLCALMLQYWLKYLQDAKKEKEEAKKLQDKLKNGKLAARKTLEQNLAGSATGLLTTAMKAWVGYYGEVRKVNELKGQAEAKLKHYQSKKKGEQASVIERMAGEQTQALMTRMFMCWTMTCLDESAARHAHNDLTNQVDDLEAQLKALQDELAQTEEDLVDTNEEIEESRKKNRVLCQEFQGILDMEQSMHSSIKQMVAE